MASKKKRNNKDIMIKISLVSLFISFILINVGIIFSNKYLFPVIFAICFLTIINSLILFHISLSSSDNKKDL